MKRKILIGLILLSSVLSLNAQWSGTDPVWTNANVGIETQTPFAKLQIGGHFNTMPDLTAISFIGGRSLRILGNDGNADYGGFISGSTGLLRFGTRYAGLDTDVLTINQNNVGIGTSSPNARLTIQSTVLGLNSGLFIKDGNSNPRGAIYFAAVGQDFVIDALSAPGGSDVSTFKIRTGSFDRLNITRDGNIGIGTTSPAYKLDVCGTIRAREVKVDLDGGCDFVFESDYKLMNIKELEKFVKTKKHLPEIAPEKEMVENGVNMKEFQMKLLQKIEELTLYTIEQNKKLEQQNEKIKALEEKIEKIEAASN